MRGRQCAICHKTNLESREGVWGFADALRRMGLVGTHAHVSCIRKWQKKIQNRINFANKKENQ